MPAILSTHTSVSLDRGMAPSYRYVEGADENAASRGVDARSQQIRGEKSGRAPNP